MENSALVYSNLYTVYSNVMRHLESESWCISSTQHEKRQIASSKWPTAQNTHLKSESVRFTWHVDEDVSFELQRVLSDKSNHSECKCICIVKYRTTSELVEHVLIPDTPYRDARILRCPGSIIRPDWMQIQESDWHIFALARHSELLSCPPARANEHGNDARTDVRKRRWCVAHHHYPVHGLPPAFTAVTFPSMSYSQAHPSKKFASANQA